MDFLSYFEAVQTWAQSYGYWGAAFVSFWEVIVLPLFPDPFILSAPALGLNVWVMTLVVSVFTILGAIAGYWLGRWLGHPFAVRIFGEEKVDRGEVLMKKYGVWAVIVTGFTPIPFKISVWLAGVFEMNFWTYMAAVIIGRVPRFILVALLGEAILKFF